MPLSEDRLNSLADQFHEEQIDGKLLAKMFETGEITKGERRKVVKLAAKKKAAAAAAPVELTERQKLRLAVKEKKAMPKLSKDDRKRKFTQGFIDEREAEKSKHLSCLGCRKKGHILRDCPDLDAQANKNVSGHCFNCGSIDHALRDCPHPKDGQALKFAKCFICGGVGHISKACPENGNGLYPKGGCCHICLQKTHLVRDCPERTEEHAAAHKLKKQQEQDAALGPRIGQVMGEGGEGGDFDDFEYMGNGGGSRDSDGEEEDRANQNRSKKSKKEITNWHKGMAKKKNKGKK